MVCSGGTRIFLPMKFKIEKSPYIWKTQENSINSKYIKKRILTYLYSIIFSEKGVNGLPVD